MSVTVEKFGTTKDGKEVHAYTLDNGTIRAVVLDFGAILKNLWVPDRNGKMDDIVLGFDRLEQYESNKDYFGATIGPVCNRTGKAEAPIDGEVFHMPVNDGPNNLHSDAALGLHKRVWNAIWGEDFVTFTIALADGECGLPGERNLTATYALTVDDGLRMHYHATSDKNTIFNLTNHSYYNLNGHDDGDIYDTRLTLNCAAFTPVAEGSIPTGEIRSVVGTPFDFSKEKMIGRDIDVDDEQLKLTGGYDHNMVIDGYTGNGELRTAAIVRSESSGRKMEVLTSLPGVQFYSANFADDPDGKNGHDYTPRHALCLETQFYPDTIHHENFPGYVFGGSKAYDAQTKLRFTAD